MNESRDQELAEGAQGRADAAVRIAPERRRALLRMAARTVPVLVATAPSIAAASPDFRFRTPTPRVSPVHGRPEITPVTRSAGTPAHAQDLGPAREIAQAMNKFR